ncbi:MAG: hypothetical protein Q8N26_28485 [Myxococcales bacterium]|nr:hypothetical protein [Myxococcales bacterium]
MAKGAAVYGTRMKRRRPDPDRPSTRCGELSAALSQRSQQSCSSGVKYGRRATGEVSLKNLDLKAFDRGTLVARPFAIVAQPGSAASRATMFGRHGRSG